MVKAIFFDIDGTLQSFVTHKIPQSAKDAISRVRRQGVKVFIATGRPTPFLNLGDVEHDGIITFNGACCVTADGQLIAQTPIPHADIERIVADSRLHPMPIAVANHHKAVTVNLSSGKEAYDYIFELLDIKKPAECPIEEILDMEVLQLVAFFAPEDDERIQRDVLKGCSFNRWHDFFADCTAYGINKATGIDTICNYYGIDVCHTAAFGDGGNDIEMLEHAGIGVAMGNASDEVKEHADMVTDHVDHDGVAKALARLVPEI